MKNKNINIKQQAIIATGLSNLQQNVITVHSLY